MRTTERENKHILKRERTEKMEGNRRKREEEWKYYLRIWANSMTNRTKKESDGEKERE